MKSIITSLSPKDWVWYATSRNWGTKTWVCRGHVISVLWTTFWSSVSKHLHFGMSKCLLGASHLQFYPNLLNQRHKYSSIEEHEKITFGHMWATLPDISGKKKNLILLSNPHTTNSKCHLESQLYQRTDFVLDTYLDRSRFGDMNQYHQISQENPYKNKVNH